MTAVADRPPCLRCRLTLSWLSRYLFSLSLAHAVSIPLKGTCYTPPVQIGVGQVIKGWDIGILGNEVRAGRGMLAPFHAHQGDPRRDSVFQLRNSRDREPKTRLGGTAEAASTYMVPTPSVPCRTHRTAARSHPTAPPILHHRHLIDSPPPFSLLLLHRPPSSLPLRTSRP